MNPAKKIMRLAMLATVFAFVSPVAFAGTVTVQHGTLSATLGAPINFSYTPDWYVVNDPTHTIGLGLRPYATLGSTMASIQCPGSANLSVSQNPGWNTLSLTPGSGTATMNLGLNAGLDIEFIAFGHTLQGSLSQSKNWGFTDSKNFSSYLLTSPVTLSGQISQTLVSLNTLDALTIEFGVVIPSWLAGINLNINAVANLDQTIQGANISTSAGAISSDGQSLNVYTSGTSYQLQNVQETWSDSATLSLGLGADMSADLLWDVLSVQLVDFGNVTLISASQTYQLQSSAISTVSFDLSTGGGSAAPVISTVSPSTMTGLPTGQTQLVRIIGSGFTSASTLTFNDGVNPSYTGRVPSSWSANELDYNISVGTNQASWSVVVVNGAQTSNLGHFTVNAPAAAPTGSLVVNLSPASANSAGAQWLLNGSYHNSGDVVTALTPGQYTVSFKPISGYTTPASQIVTITASTQTTANATYSTIAPSTYTLTLNYNSAQGGASPSPLASGNTYTAGSVVQLTAIPSTGYHFANWSGNVSGTANPTTITMDGNKSVTANFASGDPNMGTLIVTIQPPAAAAAGVKWGWNANDYRDSGTAVTTWPGTYILTVHPVDGWLGQSALYATITAGQTSNYTVTFTQDTTPGLLTVTLSPPDAVTAGAKWHVNGGIVQGNGASVSLSPGTNYTVTFDAVSGWTAPPSQTVTVQRAQTKVVAGNYAPPAGQPVIGSISPPIGPMTGGTLLTINGVNFTAPATVLIGGQPTTNVTVSSATQITCVTPSNSIYGTAPVIVQSPGGSATNLNGFAYGFTLGNKLDFVSAVGGSCFGVAVQGNYAYVGEGRNLLVLEISTPSSPSKVGQVTLSGPVMDVALFGNYAYVADLEAGLQVVDISNPTTPTIRGFYASTNTARAESITIFGGRAYVADANAGLEIFDLGNPTVPSLLTSTNCGSGLAVRVKASTNGVLAYLSTSGSLCVIDVSQPLSPVLLGQTSMGSGGVYSIALSGNYVFGVSFSDDRLHMVDVSNPSSPVDSIPSTGDNGTGGYVAVAAANNYLYAESVVSNIGFNVFSISGSTLTRIGQKKNVCSDGIYNKMFLSASRAYVAGAASGLQIVDVSNPYSPSLFAAFTDSGLYGNYWGAGISGNFLCAGSGDFKVFDVSQPSQPTLVGQLNGLGAERVVAGNGIAYFEANNNVIDIVDFSTPNSPRIVTNIPSSVVYGYRMALTGTTLYVVGNNTTFQPRFVAIDVSNASAPTVRGTKDFTSLGTGLARCVAVSGNKAVVGIISDSAPARLTVLDISNLSAPLERGSLTNLGIPVDVRVSANGNYAYALATDACVLHVVDISSPANPLIATSIPLDSSLATSLELRGNELYAATSRGLYVFDISNPASPLLTRAYSMSYIFGNICVPSDSTSQEGNIYLADSDGGLVCLKKQDIQAPNVYITYPTFSPVYTNSASSLSLGGGSDDNVGVTRVTWSNNRGGGGQVSAPFDSWFVSGITLLPGTNLLTVSAFDAAGNSGSDTLTVIYQSPKQSQTITFPTIADHTFGDPTIPLVAAASSGLPVTFSVVSGPATLSSSNVLTLTGAGAVTVEANQSGNDSFNSATPVDMNFNVTRANQSIALPPVPTHLASDPPFTITATASSALPVNFSILSGPATVNSSNVVTLLGSGTVTVSAGQPGNSNYNAAAAVKDSFTVAGSPQFITFNPLSTQKYGDAPFPIYATSSSSLPVSYSAYGPAILSGNIISLTSWGTVTVTASQPGNSAYAPAANVSQSFFVMPPVNTIGGAQFTNGGFQMAFYGTVGSNYTLQASTDLKNWTSVLNFACTNSPMNVVDPGANYLARRFYRIAQGTLPITLKLNLKIPALTKTNGFGLNLEGPLGFHYIIQASTNMLNWQPLTNFVGTTSPLNFNDPAATNFNRRFYRAVKQ